MDASLKILTVLAESVVDVMTATQLVEATGLSLSSVNAHITKLNERGYIAYSGDVVTAGRYAKQYSITSSGQQLMESGHAELIVTNTATAYIPEQMLKVFSDMMDSVATQVGLRVEKLLADLDKRAIEIAAMNAESIALARGSAIQVSLIQTTAVADKPVAKKDEEPIWKLSSYTNGEDIAPIVDKLRSEKTWDKWFANRLAELGAKNSTELTHDQKVLIVTIGEAAKAKHGWEITE